jgi:HEAT repeat protein
MLPSLAVALLVAQGPQDPAPVTLGQLAAIARQRAEELRPKQAAALEPFLGDLTLRYEENRTFLDRRLPEIAALGDAIVPLLLENLQPKREGEAGARNVADNSRRVLEHLEPASFVDELLQLLASDSDTARHNAIVLLGQTRSRRAASALIEALDKVSGPLQLDTVRALLRLRAGDAAPKVAALLANGSQELRAAAAAFLAEHADPSVREPVLAALGDARDAAVVLDLVRYLEQATPKTARAALALAPLLLSEVLDRQQQARLARALGTIAPEGHAETLAVCRKILETDGDTGALGRAAMLTMRDLGDKDGIRILLDNLKDRINRERRSPEWYVRRGEAYVELESWPRAARDYEEAIKFSRSTNEQQMLYGRLALCEAGRERWSSVVRAWRDGNLSHAAIMRQAERYPPVRAALEQRTVQRYLDSLPRDADSNGR